MEVLLIRHLESEKNLNSAFSSKTNSEKLTESGRSYGLYLAKLIEKYVLQNGLTVANIYSARSKRAKDTSLIIAKKMDTSVVKVEKFNSMSTKVYSGLTEEEVRQKDPTFISQIRLCELGLYNAYQIKRVEKGENLKQFEKRVSTAFEAILNNKCRETIKVMVLHKSSIQAILYHLARKYLQYPSDFYGYIKIDLGNICLLKINSTGFTINAINQNPKSLGKKSGMNYHFELM